MCLFRALKLDIECGDCRVLLRLSVKVGDLVRIKYDGKVGIVTGVKVQSLGGHTKPMTRVNLHNEWMTFNVDKLEVINESR